VLKPLSLDKHRQFLVGFFSGNLSSATTSSDEWTIQAAFLFTGRNFIFLFEESFPFPERLLSFFFQKLLDSPGLICVGRIMEIL
jgi:hypothetical protein